MLYLIASTRKGLIIFQKRDDRWMPDQVHFNGIPVSLAHYDPERKLLWAFQDHGHWGIKISRSGDFGKTWEDIPPPVYPDGAEVKEGIGASLRYIWAAEHLPPGIPKSMMIGTEPGGLFHWSEEHREWTLNEALWNRPERKEHWFGGGRDHPGIHSILVDPRDADHWYIGISCAGVYETTDAGQTWHIRNTGLRADFLPDQNAEVGHDPHLLAMCRAYPEVLWQQNHCGIFRSVDGGRSWQDVGQKHIPAHFGFAITCDAEHPERAWVAPAVSDEVRVAVDHALCISRTEDGGQTWESLRDGLPQAFSFDLVYRHALISKRNEIIFGTTTGNLFHSGNLGSSWQAISHHLPMVYALQFAEISI